MKRIFLLSSNILLTVILFAQDSTKQHGDAGTIVINVRESTEKMSQGYNHCLAVFIPDVRQKDVERDFARYMKQFDTKADETKGEYFFHNAVIKQLGNDPLDVYSITTQQDKGVQMEVFFNSGGVYLNSKDNTNSFEIAQRMIHDFAKQEAALAVQNQIDDAQKLLTEKSREQNDLVRQNASLHKKIKDCEQTIKDSEEGIKKNEKQQTDKQKEIEEQQKVVEALKAKAAGIE
jgi:chromosome segregation ATPase